MPTVNTKVVQTPSVTLYSGMSGSATSAKVAPYPVDLDGNKLTITDFGTSPTFTVDPKILGVEEICGFTGLVDNGDNTATLTGLTRDMTSKYPYTTSGVGRIHGANSVVVFSNNPQLYGRFPAKDNDETITGQWTFTVFPITPSNSPASATVLGVTKVSVAPVSSINPIAVGDNDPRVPVANPTTLFAPITSAPPSGIISPYVGRTAPTGWLNCDGSAVSRTTYAILFAVLCPSGTFTVTIASPAVFTKTAHGYLVGDKVHFTTTGGLPAGLATNTDYYITTVVDPNTFRVSATVGGPDVVTTGSQSGVHTVYLSAYGKGDGTTTFNLPDLRARMPISVGVPSSQTFSFDNTKLTIASPGVITVPADLELSQGQQIVLTTTGALPTGLSPGTPYWVIRSSKNATTINLAASQDAANKNQPINTSGTQSGIHTMTYNHVTSSRTILGRTGGEEDHGISVSELANHEHQDTPYRNQSGGGGNNQYTNAFSQGDANHFTGGNALHNNISPFLTVGGWIIKQ